MAKPKRTFGADEGQYSKGTAGPDQIEYDFDNIFAMFDPAATLKDGSGGGIGVENLKADATVDQTQSPSTNTGRLDILLGRIANRIKAILGLPDWKADPGTTLAALKTHIDDATQHSGIATIEGVTNPGGEVHVHGGTGISISTNPATKEITVTATGQSTPGPHASSHASGGSDPVSPASIGAETPSGAQSKVDTHASNPSAHHPRYTDAEAVAAILAADGHGSDFDADSVDGCQAGTGPDNVLKLDASGLVPLGNLPGIGAFFFYSGSPYNSPYPSAPIERNQTGTDDSTLLTVGPTGSGADIIWTDLDTVPTGAKAVRLNLRAWAAHGSAAAGSHGVGLFVHKIGVPSGSQSVYAAAHVPSEVSYCMNTVDVELDAQRRFGMLWQKTIVSNGSVSLQIYLEGWYA